MKLNCVIIIETKTFRFSEASKNEFNLKGYADEGIGIEFYSLNIVQTLKDLDLLYVTKRMPNKEYARYVILLEEKLEPEPKIYREFEAIFKQFWGKNVLNVVIIFWTTQLKVMTYTPFGERFLIEIDPKDTRLEHLFYDKVRNMLGHPLRVGLFNEPMKAEFQYTEQSTDSSVKIIGVDGLFTKLVIKKMNATLKLIQPTDQANLGELFPNGTSNGIFAYLQNQSIDVGFNARFFRHQQFRHKIETTATIGRDDLCIMVPRSGIASNLDNLFDIFKAPVWILIIIVLPLYSLIFHYYLIQRRPKESKFSRSFIETYIRFFGWNLNQPSRYIPNASNAKILLFLWIVYSAVITNWYSSAITSFLMIKPRLPDIKTLNQLEKSNLHILTIQRYVDTIYGFLNSSHEYPGLIGRVHAIEHDDIFERIWHQDTDFAFAHKEHINNFILSIGTTWTHFAQMTECPVPFLNVYALPIGSPFKGYINWILMRAKDNGLFTYWDDIKDHKDNIRTHKLNQNSHSDSHEPIKVYHLQTAFYIWGAGCFSSFCIFCAEIVWKWKHLRFREFLSHHRHH